VYNACLGGARAAGKCVPFVLAVRTIADVVLEWSDDEDDHHVRAANAHLSQLRARFVHDALRRGQAADGVRDADEVSSLVHRDRLVRQFRGIVGVVKSGFAVVPRAPVGLRVVFARRWTATDGGFFGGLLGKPDSDREEHAFAEHMFAGLFTPVAATVTIAFASNDIAPSAAALA
jgi:hypothetical protein